MSFQRRAWLWLYFRTSIALASRLHSPDQHGESTCYQLNKFHCSFAEAKHYCHAQGAYLAYAWNKEVQDLIWDFLEDGKRWWIGQHFMLLRKHQQSNSADAAASQATTPTKCTSVYRYSDWISSEMDLCSLRHYFICQADAFANLDASHEGNGSHSHLQWRPKKILREVTIMETPMTSGATHHSTMCHQPAHVHLSKTLCHPINPLSSLAPPVTQQELPATSVPTSHPAPVTLDLSRPASMTHAEMAPEQITSNPEEYSHPDVSATPLQALLQNASDQVIDEIVRNFSKGIHGLKTFNELRKVCEVLQELTASVPRFAKNSVTESFVYLSEQLQKIPFHSSLLPLKDPVTTCLLYTLNRVVKAGQSSQQRSNLDVEQVENILETSLLALGKIQEAFLQRSSSSVTLTSSVATLMLSSQNISTLPLSSYSLGDPAPVRLAFPPASGLEEILNKHPGVTIQVTGLAINPFKNFDDKNIVGSIGSVFLSSNHKLLQVQDLMEEIEMMLWRSASMETHPTSLNMSTDHFMIAVNITSLEKSLIVCIEPETPLSITLYLGFQYQPNQTHFHLNVTLPKEEVWQKDEEYTWVLTPEILQYGIGTYYITAVLNKSKEGAEQTPTFLSIITAATQCYFWDSHNRTWRSSGCQVGPQSTVLRTQCLCNRLTYFGSDFFIVPRTVNVGDTVKLFLRVTKNPVGVSLLASVLGLYIIIVLWAWKKDQVDMQKVKVTVLADNDPSNQFYYLIQVYTGYRRRASTTAKVVITLYGSEGRSDPHHLCDPQKAVFERGALDVFLLTTEASLGELHSLRLWHDNSGPSPSWYVSQVIVSEVAVKRKWHFLCNCWLAADLGDCERDQIFAPVSKRELSSFRHLFSSMIVEKFTQDYLWLSVATRHPWNQFTRVQRLTCCMTLLLCNMVINVMFWKMNGTRAKRDEQVGPFAVTWSELLISIQSAVILIPLNLVIGRLFPLIKTQEPVPLFHPIQVPQPSDASFESFSHTQVVEELRETVGFLLRRHAYLLSECGQPPWSSYKIDKLVAFLSSLISSHLAAQGCHQQSGGIPANVVSENHHHLHCYLLRVVQRLQTQLNAPGVTGVHPPGDFLSAASQLQKLQEVLEAHILPVKQGPSRDMTSFPILISEEEKKPLSNGLQRWLASLCWLFLGVTSLASAFFTVLYSLELNKDQATSWVISLVLSVLQNIFICQPVKLICLTFLLSLMLNKMPWLNKEKEQQLKRILALLAQCSSSLPGTRDKNNSIYTAPSITSLVRPPGKPWKELKLFKLTGDILVQILFLILLMTEIYSTKNSDRFHLHQVLQKTFSHRLSEIQQLPDFYPWTNHTLLPNLYGDYRGFITDGNSFLLGNVLLRQIRMPGAVLSPSRVSPQEQRKPFYQVLEATENYGPAWGPPDTNIPPSDSIWHYQSQETLHGYPIQGEFATYSGGGYAVKLGRNSSTATKVLQSLKQSHWLDRHTKCLFVEFVVFNANVNLFCVVTLILETSDVGAIFTSIRLDSLTSLQRSKSSFAWSVISQVIYYLLVCYYAFVQGRRLQQQRWRFFCRKRNILDTSMILMSFVVLGLDMKRISLHKKNLARYRHDRDGFISFCEAVQMSSAVIHLQGFLVLLATVQLWSLLRHDPRLQVIGSALSRAWDEVVGFLLTILLLLTSYAMAFNLLFGWIISDYRTFFSSTVTVVGILMGISHHKEVIALDPVLGSFLIFTGVILMVLVVINLFVSAILMAFGKERKSLKIKKEAALIDILLRKLWSLLGIQQHQTTPWSKQVTMPTTGHASEVPGIKSPGFEVPKLPLALSEQS